MRLPSVRSTFGDSAIARSTRSTTAFSDDIRAAMPPIAGTSARSAMISGMGRSDAASALRSRALARPESTFAMRRSRSRTSPRRACRDKSRMRSFTNASTQSRRALISATCRSGWRIHAARRRAPIGVRVALSTPSSDASRDTPSPGRSARWRIVPASSARKSALSRRRTLRTCPTAWRSVVCT